MDINIVNLPLEILMKICQHLHKTDKRNFARTHPKLWDAFVRLKRDKVQEIFYIPDSHSTEKWKFNLEWYGPDLKEVIGIPDSIDEGELVETLGKFCPNLTKLCIAITKEENIKILEEYLPKFQKLRDISILDRSSYKSKLLKILQGLPNLRALHCDLESFDTSDRLELNKLIQLEELDADSLKPNEIKDISTLLGCIRELNTNELPYHTLCTLPEYCKNVEKLLLFKSHVRSEFPYFPKLNNIYSSAFSSDIYFTCQFDKRYNDQLKVLYLGETHIDETEFKGMSKLRALEKLGVKIISQDHILKLVKEVTTLKELSCCCYTIDKQFLPKLLDSLKTEDGQTDRPFKLYISIDESMHTMLNKQLKSMPIPKSLIMGVDILSRFNF